MLVALSPPLVSMEPPVFARHGSLDGVTDTSLNWLQRYGASWGALIPPFDSPGSFSSEELEPKYKRKSQDSDRSPVEYHEYWWDWSYNPGSWNLMRFPNQPLRAPESQIGYVFPPQFVPDDSRQRC